MEYKILTVAEFVEDVRFGVIRFDFYNDYKELREPFHTWDETLMSVTGMMDGMLKDSWRYLIDAEMDKKVIKIGYKESARLQVFYRK